MLFKTLNRNFSNKNNKIALFGYLVLTLGLIYLYFKAVHSNNKRIYEYNENIDLVYTWVNGSDDEFIKIIRKYNTKYESSRYNDRNELKYSLRSLEKYAPWINHVYIVTNGQIPNWLNLDYEKVSVIPHHQLAQDPDILPTFSSNVIEQFLHRIPNLSKRFLYLNDDIFLGSELYLADLYSQSKGIHVYTTTKIPNCAPDCPWSRLNDGICDKQCNLEECEFDGNDCVPDNNKYRETEYEDLSSIYERSSINSSKVFNLAYGLKKRYMLPQIGFLFDKDIIEDMLQKFPKEFNNTRHNKFRTMDDMLFPFSFSQYLMSETVYVSMEQIFDKFDTDRSETWSNDEIDSIIRHLYPEPLLNAKTIQDFETIILNCFEYSIDGSNGENVEDDFNEDLKFPTISKKIAIQCLPLTEILLKTFSQWKKYKFQVISGNGYIDNFMVLNSNIPEVLSSLNNMWTNPKKFNCINDDFRLENNEKIIQIIDEILYKFYTKLFPHPSKFELPISVQNRFGYIDDYFEYKRMEQNASQRNTLLGTLLIFFVFTLFIKYKYSQK